MDKNSTILIILAIHVWVYDLVGSSSTRPLQSIQSQKKPVEKIRETWTNDPSIQCNATVARAVYSYSNLCKV